MRNLSFCKLKWDKKYLIAFSVTLICAIISGIVLYIFANINIYFENYAHDYVYFVFNFKNGNLIFPHLLSETIIIYIIFSVCYFTKFKYLTLIIFFIRGIYFTVYTAILIELNTFGGITVAVFVFIPTSFCSLFFGILIAESCKIINKKYIFVVPVVLAVVNTLLFLILINIVFRLIIVIV